jgi:hypothetical protein
MLRELELEVGGGGFRAGVGSFSCPAATHNGNHSLMEPLSGMAESCRFTARMSSVNNSYSGSGLSAGHLIVTCGKSIAGGSRLASWVAKEKVRA